MNFLNPGERSLTTGEKSKGENTIVQEKVPLNPS